MNKHFFRCLAATLLLTSAVADTPTPRQPQPSRGRALLVGINEYQQREINPVRGAIEDATATREFLKTQYGFTDEQIHLLTGPQATRANILTEFNDWLIAGTRPGDRVFFLYSGHGSQLRDDDGDEGPDDAYDETFAPYDVGLQGENQIRDDEINDLIAQLSGRLAVLVFDSCHSGTIARGTGGTAAANAVGPRYLPSPEEFARLRANARGTGGGSGYQVEETAPPQGKQLITRNLRLVEEKMAGSTSGVVVISAAQAGQTAYPLLIDRGWRGALSYLFNELQRGRTLKFSQLRQEITACIAEWRQQGRLKGRQVPAFEVLSQYPLDNLPLFAATQEQTVAPLIAFANPQSKLKVALRSLESKTQYRVADKISYEVTTNAAGWLYLLVFSQKNQATCIFPTKENEDDRDNRVTAGKHRLPRSQSFYAQEPLGKDVVIALLSSVPLNLGDQENLTWDEVFERLRSKKLTGYVKTRGVGTKKPATTPSPASLEEADWQAASLVLETIAKTAGRNIPANRRSATGRSIPARQAQ